MTESYEEKFRHQERKERRQERRRASQRDRSQFKKTDRKKVRPDEEMHPNIKIDREELFKGKVLSIISQEVRVHCNGAIHLCVLRGLLKRDRQEQKNLLAVGDEVLFDEEGVIHHIEPRRSVLSRADNLSRRKEQILAVNVDQVLITASVEDPPLKPFLIDRYVIAARKGKMEPVIVVNKVDQLEGDLPLYEEAVAAYQVCGIQLLPVSAETGEGLDELRAVMQGKVSVFSGQSGVGKSSLINAVTGMDLATGETVKRTRKGSHTTTHSQLLPLEFGGWCVDTPGIKSFGLWDLKKEEIAAYYSEIQEVAVDCKFSSCTHIHEPGCAVLEAVEEGKISVLRYESYRQLVETIEEEHKRR